MVTGDTHIPGAMNNLSIATSQAGSRGKARAIKGKPHGIRAVKAKSVKGGQGPSARGPMRPVGRAK